MSPPRLRLAAEPLNGLPEVRPGDDLSALIVDCAAAMVAALRGGEVLVVAQKVVSYDLTKFSYVGGAGSAPGALWIARRKGIASVAELLAYARGREVLPVEPRVVLEGEVARILLPGDPGY